MALFKKKNKNVDQEQVKEVKAESNVKKGSKKKGGRKNKSLLNGLNFPESVLTMVRSNLESEPGAVRRVGDAYVLVSITDEMLSGFSAKDEAIGSFAKAVKDGSISSVVLSKDIESGRLVLIPDDSSINRMDEYSFLRNMEYELVLFSDDLDDDDQVTVLDTLVDFSDIRKMADNRDITYELHGTTVDIVDRIVDTGATAGAADMYVAEEPQDEPETIDDVPLDNDIPDLDDFDAEVPAGSDYDMDFNDVPSDDIPDFDDAPISSDLDVSDEYDAIDSAASDSDDFEDFSDDYDSYDSYDIPEAEPQSREDVYSMVERTFLNDDLEIPVTDELFNVHFNTDRSSIPLFVFSEKTTDETSDLERNIRKMAETANTNIERIHQQNLSALKEDYFHALSQERENIAQQLALDSDDNDYGMMMLATKKEALEDDYEREKKAFIDDAISASGSRYDAMHKNELKRRLETIEDTFELEVKQAENKKKTEILEARKEKAAALYNTASVRILQGLSDEYRLMQEEELELYETEKKKMDDYLKENFANDVMRARAIRDELTRHNEVDDLKARYAALQDLNETRLEEVRKQAKDSLAAVSQKHDKIVEEMSKDFEKELNKSKAREEKAYDDFKKLQHDYATIDDKKNAEFEHRLSVMQDEIDAKNRQIESMQAEIGKKNNISIILMIVIALAFLAVGIALGFIVTPAHAAEIASDTSQASFASIPALVSAAVIKYKFRK